jgi:hypothetical protein
VSHTFLIYFDVDFQRDMVMEATDGGFRIVPFDRYTKHADYLRVFKPRLPIDTGLMAAVDWLGERYDYTGVFGMAWVMFGRWLKRKWHNPWHGANALFCSEAVTKVLQAASYPGVERLEPETTTPEDLLEFFRTDEARG